MNQSWFFLQNKILAIELSLKLPQLIWILGYPTINYTYKNQ